MNAQEVLLRAAELVEQGWTQGRYARDRYGHEISATDPKAVRWCIYGAIDCASRDTNSLITEAVSALGSVIVGDTPAHWQDHLPRSKKSQALVAEKLREAASLST